MKYRVGDFLIVESSFKSDGNVFHRGDILRVVIDYTDANENGYVISNKSWIFSQEDIVYIARVHIVSVEIQIGL